MTRGCEGSRSRMSGERLGASDARNEKWHSARILSRDQEPQDEGGMRFIEAV
jgi:hypothetical protein